MLEVEGYKMFKGTAVIVPKVDNIKPFKVGGTWLFKPEWGLWYVNGMPYSNEVVTNIVEEG